MLGYTHSPHASIPNHIIIPATTGVFVKDLWPLITDRLPVGGIQTLGPRIKQILWRYLRTEPAAVEHLEFLLDPVIPPGTPETRKPKKLPNGRWRATDMTPTPPLDERIEKVEDAEALGVVVRVGDIHGCVCMLVLLVHIVPPASHLSQNHTPTLTPPTLPLYNRVPSACVMRHGDAPAKQHQAASTP